MNYIEAPIALPLSLDNEAMMPPRRKKLISPLFVKLDRTCNSFSFCTALAHCFVFVFNRNPYCCCFAPKLASNLALNWLLAEVVQRFGQSNWRLYIDSYSMTLPFDA